MDIYLETARMVLRQFTEDDVPLLVELDSDPEVMRYLTGGEPTPEARIREEVLPRLIRQYGTSKRFGLFAAHEKAGGEFLGWFAFRPKKDSGSDDPELGYRLRRAAWGKGYATEGSLALIRKGFTELGVQRVFAETMFVNDGSRHVMEKAGLTYVRTFFQDWPEAIAGSEHGEVEYALERADWERSEGAE
jgi:RimJ/RimL family protein N-acetyltransferase